MVTIEKQLRSIFCGKVNVAKAAHDLDLDINVVKKLFEEYVQCHTKEDWELDTEPCWPYN